MERYKPTKHKSPVKAIREHCIECMGGRESEGHSKRINECNSPDCALYDFRYGKSPFRKKQTNKQLLRARANLEKARKSPKPRVNLDVI